MIAGFLSDLILNANQNKTITRTMSATRFHVEGGGGLKRLSWRKRSWSCFGEAEREVGRYLLSEDMIATKVLEGANHGVG